MVSPALMSITELQGYDLGDTSDSFQSNVH